MVKIAHMTNLETESSTCLLENIANNSIDISTIEKTIQNNLKCLRERWNNGRNAYHVAVRTSMITEKYSKPNERIALIVSLLKEYGLDINSIDNYGNTPLMYVLDSIVYDWHPSETNIYLKNSYKINVGCLYVLLINGANVNIKNIHGYNILHLMAIGGICNHEIVAPILDADYDINAVTPCGNTVLTLLANHFEPATVKIEGYNETISKSSIIDYIDTLVRFGANINHQNKDGDTFLHIHLKKFKKRSNSLIIETAITLGADISIPNKKGKTVKKLMGLSSNKRCIIC